MKRSNLAALVCAVLSAAAISQPAWAADSLLNKHAAATAKLAANQLGKAKRLASLRTRALSDAASKHKTTLLKQALALASSAHDNETNTLSNHISSWRSQFTSKSVRDAIGTLGRAAGIEEASE